MKTIKALLILQLIMLGLLVYKSVLNNEKTDEMPVLTKVISSSAPPPLAEEPKAVTPTDVDIDEKKLRRIIRSELEAHTLSLVEALQESPEPVAEVDRVENAKRLDIVQQELAYYLDAGKIADNEMRDLQQKISVLDQESSMLMLGELVRALNSGDLQGRL